MWKSGSSRALYPTAATPEILTSSRASGDPPRARITTTCNEVQLKHRRTSIVFYHCSCNFFILQHNSEPIFAIRDGFCDQTDTVAVVGHTTHQQICARLKVWRRLFAGSPTGKMPAPVLHPLAHAIVLYMHPTTHCPRASSSASYLQHDDEKSNWVVGTESVPSAPPRGSTGNTRTAAPWESHGGARAMSIIERTTNGVVSTATSSTPLLALTFVAFEHRSFVQLVRSSFVVRRRRRRGLSSLPFDRSDGELVLQGDV